MGFLQRV
jgi:hypothetical protein